MGVAAGVIGDKPPPTLEMHSKSGRGLAPDGISSDSEILQRTHILIQRINLLDLLDHRLRQW
jgi:hypothetical protein